MEYFLSGLTPVIRTQILVLLWSPIMGRFNMCDYFVFTLKSFLLFLFNSFFAFFQDQTAIIKKNVFICLRYIYLIRVHSYLLALTSFIIQDITTSGLCIFRLQCI